jgi:hypothetical protein
MAANRDRSARRCTAIKPLSDKNPGLAPEAYGAGLAACFSSRASSDGARGAPERQSRASLSGRLTEDISKVKENFDIEYPGLFMW